MDKCPDRQKKEIVNGTFKNNRKIVLSGKKADLQKAVFLDRDGIIIKDKHYISDWRDVELRSGAVNLLAYAKENNYLCFVITNQSCIARGLFKWNEYSDVTQRMLQLLGPVHNIDAIYAAGGMNENGQNSWRKPGIGMIREACNDLNIDCAKSILIGDRFTDILAGYNANIKILVHAESETKKNELQRINKWMEQNNVDTDANGIETNGKDGTESKRIETK